MKIKTVKIKNFRSYSEEVEIDFEDMTVFVGKNDIGKSTVLEALDIFFNSGTGAVKLDKEDINKSLLANGDKEVVISVVFEDLPEKVVVDTSHETMLLSEYLLNADSQLEIIKKYPNASTGSEKVFIKAHHPIGDNVSDLLQKKSTDLRKITKQLMQLCVKLFGIILMQEKIYLKLN